LINLEQLVQESDLKKADLSVTVASKRIDYTAVEQYKYPLLIKAATNFFARGERSRMEEFWHFCDSTFWLHDYALFMALKAFYKGKGWCDWPAEISSRTSAGLEEFSRNLGAQIGAHKYMQWQFARQWHAVRSYANGHGISVLGDIPIFVAFDSADVWANPSLFQLDDDGRPRVVAGVPPDYFSKTGQLWGNPLYDWERMSQDGYGWWVARIRNDLSLYDNVRIDHFRGFEAFWEIPRREKTAVNGRWVKGPGENLFHALSNALGTLPIIAEDLGVITPEVEALRDHFHFPGMKILQFAFGSGPDNAYLPHNHVRNCVVYTGTHDNDTTLGWFSSLKEKEKHQVRRYLNYDKDDIVWELIRTTLASVARDAVIPMQDVLCLDSLARMNIPGVAAGNWAWRLDEKELVPGIASRLHDLVEIYGRKAN
jgi:4-alpha-glucanotransferase